MLADADVALHCITAQPGGAAGLHAELEKRDAAVDPGLALHSSPDHAAIYPGTEDIFIAKPHEEPEYNMIQPAVVVVNDQEEVVQSWSWKSELDGDGNVGSTEMQMIPQAGGEPVPLVTLRISTDDIAPAIKEGREIKRVFTM